MDLPSTRFARLLGTALTLGTLATLAPPCRGQAVGDANCDSEVGPADAAALEPCIAGPLVPADAACAAAFDIDRSGRIDLRDLLGVQRAMTQNIRLPEDQPKRWRLEALMVSAAALATNPVFPPGGVEASFQFNLAHRLPPQNPPGSGPPCSGRIGWNFLALKQETMNGSRVVFAGLTSTTDPLNPDRVDVSCYREVKANPAVNDYIFRSWSLRQDQLNQVDVSIRSSDPADGRWRIRFIDEAGEQIGLDNNPWPGWRNEAPDASLFYHEQLCAPIRLPGRFPLARRFFVFDARVFPPGLNVQGFDVDTFAFQRDLPQYEWEFIPDTIPGFETWDTR